MTQRSFFHWIRSVETRLGGDFDMDWDWRQVFRFGYSPAQAVADFLEYHPEACQ